MYSRHHLVVSVVVVVPFLGWYDGPGGWPALLAWAAAVGVFVDLDHFLLARWRTGSWEPLRRTLSSARVAVVDQEEIFETGDVGQMRRMASHLVIAGVLTGLLALVSASLAVATAVVLYAHVLGDAVWDTWQNDSGD
ncbi:hypothetical protein ACKVMT_00490 [Halobacteriales archaeon Cl-PHB]